VYDGGGVDPDVILPKPEHSKIADALYLKNYIFEFASSYKLLHENIDDASKFKLSDKDFDDFVAFVKSKDFSYKTESEEKLDALKSAATDEKYFDAVKEHYESIKSKLARDKEQDLVKNKAEISSILENEIAGRYYYAYGKVKKSYQNDTEVAKAIELIKNPKEYSDILAKK
jgi:carboxyl-terminal processing protease